MWSNKPSASTPPSGDSPERDAEPRSRAPGPASGRGVGREAGPPSGRGIAGGLRIVGEIKGRDDLFIAGEVSGSVYLPDCGIHVGPNADINANMTARVIEIEGRVTGDLTASQRIAIRSSATVTGDVISPQIQIDEGCKFKGSVQMREPGEPQKHPAVEAEEVRYRAANE